MVVHDHRHIGMLCQQSRDCPRPLLAQAAARRVVRARRQDDSLSPLGKGVCQTFCLNAFRIHGHADRLQSDGAQHVDAAQEAGIFDRYLVPSHQIRVEQPLDGIDGAMRQIDFERRGAVGLEPFPRIRFQPGIDSGFAIEPRLVGAALQRGRDIRQPLDIRIAAGKIGQGAARQRAFLLTRLVLVADDRAKPPLRHGNARHGEALVGRGHRVPIDAQFQGQVAYGGKRRSGEQLPGLRQGAYTVEDLRGGLAVYFHWVPGQSMCAGKPGFI